MTQTETILIVAGVVVAGALVMGLGIARDNRRATPSDGGWALSDLFWFLDSGSGRDGNDGGWGDGGGDGGGGD